MVILHLHSLRTKHVFTEVFQLIIYYQTVLEVSLFANDFTCIAWIV